jgi:uncharacterized membrane protein YhaH (DUF805 family)
LGGFRLEDVKRSLGELFKLDEAGQARLFSGARVVLKRSVDRVEAQRYVARLARIGARLYMEPSHMPAPSLDTPLPTITFTEPAAAPPAPRQAAAVPATPAPVAAAAAEEIVCPTCGERQSKRLLCRSCATNMPMGIAARLEAEQEARAARMDELRARRGLRSGGAGEAASEDAPSAWGLEMSGRMGRLTYATAGSVAMAVLFLALLWLVRQPSAPRACAFALVALGVAVLSVRWTVLRLHDCNHTGKWFFVLFVPYLGLLMNLLLWFMPGTRGDNDHGGPPRKGSWLLLLLSFALLVPSTGMLSSAVLRAMQEGGLPFAGGQEARPASLELTSDDASDAFQTGYAAGAANKAFAVSADGAWGWHAGAASPDEAMRAAVADCDTRRKPYTAPCEAVSVNGR